MCGECYATALEHLNYHALTGGIRLKETLRRKNIDISNNDLPRVPTTSLPLRAFVGFR